MANRSANRERATPDRWKHESLPSNRKSLDVHRTYPLDTWDQINRGLIPEEMEDKWFIYADGPWLYFHRSWTGYCIYTARFELQPEYLRLAEAWVSRDSTQYTEDDDIYDRGVLYFLIDRFLLDDPNARLPAR